MLFPFLPSTLLWKAGPPSSRTLPELQTPSGRRRRRHHEYYGCVKVGLVASFPEKQMQLNKHENPGVCRSSRDLQKQHWHLAGQRVPQAEMGTGTVGLEGTLRVIQFQPPALGPALLWAITQGNTKVSKICSSQNGRKKNPTVSGVFSTGWTVPRPIPLETFNCNAPHNASKTTDDEHLKTH